MQTKVIITIDTEVRSHDRTDAFEHDVLGCTQSNPRGAYWIAERLSSFQLTGVFYLDVYGSAIYGEDRYRPLCDRLLKGGHSIQLHTHPDQMYDRNRRHMHEYSLQKQTEIIRDGMGLLKDWTGKLPTSHRAGRYGANEETLDAIKMNGIRLDSSFFFGRADCKLPYPNTNLPFETRGVWEIPVTVAPEAVEKKGFRFPDWTRHFWRRYQKLDVNCMPAWQLCRSVAELRGKVPYVVIFLHSFSFTHRETGGFVPDVAAINTFEALLKFLSDQKLQVVDFDLVEAELKLPETVSSKEPSF